MADLDELYQSVILDHNRNPGISGGWTRPTARPRATIRSAETS